MTLRCPSFLLRPLLALTMALAGLLLPLSLPATTSAIAEESVMNWRASLPPRARAVPEAPAYRARRRIDAAPRYQDDAALGLHMPALKLDVPILADPNAPLIAFVGDSLADALHFGFDGDPGLKSTWRLVNRTSSASGLVREDYFSWPKTIATLLAEQRDIAALVLMIGLNDRQAIRVGDQTLEPLTEPWREEYRKRVDSILTLARDAKVPVFWVGLPLMRSPKLSEDLVALNTLIRERVAIYGQTYVDTVDAFADASGAFSATGPDVIGDIVRLRGADGIHFTPAGQRKLAFFVDRALSRLPNERPQPAIAALPLPAPAVAPQAANPLPQPVRLPTTLGPNWNATPGGIVIAPMRPPVGEVRPVAPARQANTLVERPNPAYGDNVNRNLFDRGLAPAARPGRSDDYGWR
ncbi:MAG: DUF459 domain-containing protein [Beijerinckiaceae bacterium]|jgi:hypothetical protein|nr:DUF459 domain-containing protein [Beijerinckiaceae bacterium]